MHLSLKTMLNSTNEYKSISNLIIYKKFFQLIMFISHHILSDWLSNHNSNNQQYTIAIAIAVEASRWFTYLCISMEIYFLVVLWIKNSTVYWQTHSLYGLAVQTINDLKFMRRHHEHYKKRSKRFKMFCRTSQSHFKTFSKKQFASFMICTLISVSMCGIFVKVKHVFGYLFKYLMHTFVSVIWYA